MKKFILLFLIFTMLFVHVSANEVSTREELLIKLFEAFDLEGDSLFPLLRYKDWASIHASNRLQVAAALKNGLFAPEEKLLYPDKVITDADLDFAVKGIMRYIAAKENLQYNQGTVTIADNEKIILNTGLAEYTASRSVFYLEMGLDTFSALKVSQKVDFAVNEEGKVLLGWDPKRTNNNATILKTGQLYLYHWSEDCFILKNVSYYRDGTWKEVPNGRYEKIQLDNHTYIVSEGKRIRREELNQNYLDRNAIVLIDQNTQKILYAVIQS